MPAGERLIYVSGQVALDESGALVGNQITIADPVGFDSGFSAAAISVSDGGLVAYRTGAATR